MPANALGRLVALVRSNERLAAELARVDRKRLDAIDHLTGPGANVPLAGAVLARLAARRRELLDRLEDNRMEAERLLGRPVLSDPEPCPACAN
jgi:hypothetical protein